MHTHIINITTQQLHLYRNNYNLINIYTKEKSKKLMDLH